MINGVLTERTVKEVIPMLLTNTEGLKKALEELVRQYKIKQDEMEKWKVRLTNFEAVYAQVCPFSNTARPAEEE
jgi:predicted phage tail protein